MRTRHLGSAGPHVSALGLGCGEMSGTYGPADETESVATIRAALDVGVSLLDTADSYGMGHRAADRSGSARPGPRSGGDQCQVQSPA
jgi:aryl-alcohol dehydrogenase-like predicted oxidoreductase